MTTPIIRLNPVSKSPESVASDHVAKAFDAIRRARTDADALKREAEAKMREEIAMNLRIVIDARRTHLKLAQLFDPGAQTTGLPLTSAIEIEDGMNIDFRDVSIYLRTVAEALVVRAKTIRD
jgi:hypothetical protein